MKTLLKLHPDLHACELEDRVLPVVPNVGLIVLTTSGYVLMTPFSGASGYSGGLTGSAIPTSFAIMGTGGISSMQPGAIAGLPSPAPTATNGTSGANGGASVTLAVGSGANDASALGIRPVNRNTIANDKPDLPPAIGQVFGDRTPVLPAGQTYRGGVPSNDTAPVRRAAPRDQPEPAPVRRTTFVPLSRMGMDPHRLPAEALAHPVERVAVRLP
jgi:hypothetical protein